MLQKNAIVHAMVETVKCSGDKNLNFYFIQLFYGAWHSLISVTLAFHQGFAFILMLPVQFNMSAPSPT